MVYVASTLDNAGEARMVAEALEQDGWVITYPWWTHGSVQAEGDERIREVAELELAGVLMADLVVLVLPGGRGTHVEIGAALAVIRMRKHFSADTPGPRAAIIFGRDKHAAEQWMQKHRHAPERLAGGTHDADGRTCAFYLHPGVTLVSKDRGLDGLRLEALRALKVAPQ